jgi:elongation factor P
VHTGAKIQVPIFVNNEDWIVVDTRTGAYVERAKK